MPKTAAELVPLKTQLKNSMGLFRFNDPTTDFLNPTTGQWLDFDLNLSGWDPVEARLRGNSSARPPAAVTTPTNFAVNATNVGALTRVGIQYLMMAYDAANLPNQATVVWIQPGTDMTGTGSVTLSWPAIAGASYIRVWGREDWGTYLGGWSYRQLVGTATSTVITNLQGTLGTNSTTTAPPYPSSASTAPPFPPITLTYNTSGGNFSPHVVGYRVSAYTAMGETPPAAPLYIQPQGAPKVDPTGRVQGVTATESAADGTLAAAVYYYAVTARTELMRNNYSTQSPWYGESLPSAEVVVDTGGATPSTRVDLSWPNVPDNVGYHVYRGTATGELFYLGSTGANVTSFADTGAATPSTTMRPPHTYNGAYIPGGGASLTWTAVANAAGYWVFRSGWNPNNTTAAAAYDVVGGATTTFTDTAAATVTRYSNGQNLSGIGQIRTAGHYFRLAAGDYIDRIGFTIDAVAGQRYRLVLRNFNNNVQQASAHFTAAGGVQYFEFSPNVLGIANNDYWAYIQAVDVAGAFSWPVVPVNLTAVPGALVTHHHGQYVWANANTDSSTVYGNGGGSSGNQPTGVQTLASVGLPIRLALRRYRASSALVNAAGNLLGADDNRPQYVLTHNQTYTTPIRSIIPTWNATKPVSPKNQALMLATHLGVEVSTDGGGTWAKCTLDQRYYFQAPATQVMFRIVFPPFHWFQSMNPYLVNYPSHSGTTGGAWRSGHQGSSSDFGAYWEFRDAYNAANGWWPGLGQNFYVFSHNYNNLSSDMVIAYDAGADVEVRGEFWPEYGGVGEGGPRVRYNRARGGTDTAGGLMLCLNNDGNCYLRDITGNTTSTILATATGCVVPNAWNHARFVASGDRFLGWVNHRLVFDVTNTTYPSTATNASAGAGGRKTRVRDLSVAPLAPGGSFSDPTRQPARFEFDFLAVYLEV